MEDFDKTYLGQLRKLVGDRKIIITAARAVVLDNDERILFIRRRDNGKWGMPAGSQELNESILDCLIREVKEETGLDVIRATPMAIYSNISIVTSFQDPYHLFLVQFLVDLWTGELMVETDETVDARFFSLDALPEDLVDHYYEAVEDLRNYEGELIVK